MSCRNTESEKHATTLEISIGPIKIKATGTQGVIAAFIVFVLIWITWPEMSLSNMAPPAKIPRSEQSKSEPAPSQLGPTAEQQPTR